MEAIELYKEETMKAAELKASGRKQVFNYSVGRGLNFSIA